jgi:hypothetical protein
MNLYGVPDMLLIFLYSEVYDVALPSVISLIPQQFLSKFQAVEVCI